MEDQQQRRRHLQKEGGGGSGSNRSLLAEIIEQQQQQQQHDDELKRHQYQQQASCEDDAPSSLPQQQRVPHQGCRRSSFPEAIRDGVSVERGSLPSHYLSQPPPSSLSTPPSIYPPPPPRYYHSVTSFSPKSPNIDSYSHSSLSGVGGAVAQPSLSLLSEGSPSSATSSYSPRRQSYDTSAMGNKSTAATVNTTKTKVQRPRSSSLFSRNEYDAHERYFTLASFARQQGMEWEERRRQKLRSGRGAGGEKCSNLTVLMNQQQQLQQRRSSSNRESVEQERGNGGGGEQTSSSPTDEQACRQLKQEEKNADHEGEENVSNLKPLTEMEGKGNVAKNTANKNGDETKELPLSTNTTGKDNPPYRSNSSSSYLSSSSSSASSRATPPTKEHSSQHHKKLSRQKQVTPRRSTLSASSSSSSSFAEWQQQQQQQKQQQHASKEKQDDGNSKHSSISFSASAFDTQKQHEKEKEFVSLPPLIPPPPSAASSLPSCMMGMTQHNAVTTTTTTTRRSSMNDVLSSQYSNAVKQQQQRGGGSSGSYVCSNTMSKSPIRMSSSMGGGKMNVRRCESNKELGGHYGPPPSTSPYAFMLYQKEKIETTMHQRLVALRESVPLSDDHAANHHHHHHRPTNKETRNKRRAEHNQAVINDLCEIVCELLVAESKLLNPRLQPFLQHHHHQPDEPCLSTVRQFLSDLPPRYALGVDTPSEVLVHMRLMAAARADNTRAAVHIVNVDPSLDNHQQQQQYLHGKRRAVRLVTISCADVDGLLEYITRLLGTGGSRVLDADVMLSKDNIALDRFVVEMTGRLRLDKLQQYIESYLKETRGRMENSSASSPSPLEEDDEAITSTSMSNPSNMSQQHAQPSSAHASSSNNNNTLTETDHHAYGPLYYNPPPKRAPESPRNRLHEEMQTAVPLSAVVASASSSNVLQGIHNSPGTQLSQQHHRNNGVDDGHVSSPPTCQTSGECGHEGGDSRHYHQQQQHTASPATTDRPPRRRQLVNREARNLSLDGENELADFMLQNPSLTVVTRSNTDNHNNEIGNATLHPDIADTPTVEEQEPLANDNYNNEAENSRLHPDIDVAPTVEEQEPSVHSMHDNLSSSLQQQQQHHSYHPSSYTAAAIPSSPIVPVIPFDELMLIETLGEGRVSTIYRAAWRQGGGGGGNDTVASPRVDEDGFVMVALKVATATNPDHHHHQDNIGEGGDWENIEELRREADIAGMLHHHNICELVGVAYDSECFCLAYEYCENGSLLSLLSDTSRCYEYLPIALDIANGMAYLHSCNVIHRDLKPSNILLTKDNRAKIADFGMSVTNTGQELTAETGTYRWMAPEVIRHESYSSNADVYSFGLVLWQLVTREVPFATMTPIQTAYAVAQGQRPEIPSSTPEPLRRIIRACWDADSHKRPSFTYIAMALADYAKMAFNPANVGAQTVQIANDMLANVPGNATVNVDFSAPVSLPNMNSATGGASMGSRGLNDSSHSRNGGTPSSGIGGGGGWFFHQGPGSYGNGNIGLEI